MIEPVSVILIISVCSLTWTDLVVGTEGILHFLPMKLSFIPEWLIFPIFHCPICNSGWIYLTLHLILGHTLLFLIPGCFVTMYVTGILKKYLNPYE